MTDSTAQNAGEVSPLSILIADDSSAIRAVLRHLVAGCAEQWHVCADAIDGREAIEKGINLRPDAILLDLSIPVVSGLEAAKILQRECPASEVILMSAQEPAVLELIAASAKVRYSISKALLAEQLTPLMQRISLSKRSRCSAA
ncbi:MAG: response regulator transcription factor [Candidatus Acidiferrales bacterium]